MCDQHCISTQETRCVVNAMGFFAQGIRFVINAVGVGVLLFLFLFLFGGGGCQGNKVCDQCYGVFWPGNKVCDQCCGGWCFVVVVVFVFVFAFFVVVVLLLLLFFLGGAKGTRCVINAMAAFFLRNNVCGDTASLPSEQVMNTAFLRRKEGV